MKSLNNLLPIAGIFFGYYFVPWSPIPLVPLSPCLLVPLSPCLLSAIVCKKFLMEYIYICKYVYLSGCKLRASPDKKMMNPDQIISNVL